MNNLHRIILSCWVGVLMSEWVAGSPLSITSRMILGRPPRGVSCPCLVIALHGLTSAGLPANRYIRSTQLVLFSVHCSVAPSHGGVCCVYIHTKDYIKPPRLFGSLYTPRHSNSKSMGNGKFWGDHNCINHWWEHILNMALRLGFRTK